MYLGSEEIKRLVKEQNLVTGYIDLEKQLQPNGFDLTVQKIEIFEDFGEICFAEKRLPTTKEKEHAECWVLKKGVYLVTFNETLKFPKGIAGLAFQRSTVMRCGAIVNTSNWDSGYEGRGQSILVVFNDNGLVIHQNARIAQMQFIKIVGENFLYEGNYQKENIPK